MMTKARKLTCFTMITGVSGSYGYKDNTTLNRMSLRWILHVFLDIGRTAVFPCAARNHELFV
jgi:hypothetical protein